MELVVSRLYRGYRSAMQESYNVDNTYNVDSAPRTPKDGGETGERGETDSHVDGRPSRRTAAARVCRRGRAARGSGGVWRGAPRRRWRRGRGARLPTRRGSIGGL
eukprot:scaffold23131_cov61-Phaeocystis_antarctica.AAC.11